MEKQKIREHQFITPAECDCGGTGHCNICDGGLAICKICGGAEGSLPTECPGEKMIAHQDEAVYAGKLDFFNGQWTVILSSHRIDAYSDNHRHEDIPQAYRVCENADSVTGLMIYGLYNGEWIANPNGRALIRHLLDELQKAQEEIKISDKLLAERNRVLEAIPECPIHGKQCIPHAMDWIQRKRGKVSA
ncbi:MAG: hypothetical protein AB1553_01875 [Nitrospirota bacterium]